MLYLGIDVGTTGTKAALYDARGNVHGRGYYEYGLEANAGGEVEQDAEEWWNGLVSSVKSALCGNKASEVCAIALSTQGASMAAVDGDFKPLSKALTWMDSRAKDESDYLISQLGNEKIYRMAGWSAGAFCDSAKILWLRRNRRDIFDKAASFVSTLEFVNCRLTGNNVSDPTNSAIRVLTDIEKGDYSDDILNLIGVSRSRLPEIRDTGAYVGKLTSEAAELLGLPRDVRVFNGAHDQYAAALGSGAVKCGDMLLATGTTWVVLGVTDRLIYTESRISPGIHPVKGLCGAMASIVSAGSALKWYKNIAKGDYDELDSGAEKSLQSARELYCMPYVAGAGFPHRLESVGGTLTGFRLEHDRYDIARSIMEGVAFEIRTVLENYATPGGGIRRLKMTGKAAGSRVWRAIVRDITGCEVCRNENDETCTLGAAMLAAVGIGEYPSLEKASEEMVREGGTEYPDISLRDFYGEKYTQYCELFNKIYK